MAKMQVCYNRTSLLFAAIFLEKNNELCKQDRCLWKEQILDMMMKNAARRDASLIGTGGFYLKFSQDDAVSPIDVDILVDPAVGKESDYMTVVIEDER